MERRGLLRRDARERSKRDRGLGAAQPASLATRLRARPGVRAAGLDRGARHAGAKRASASGGEADRTPHARAHRTQPRDRDGGRKPLDDLHSPGRDRAHHQRIAMKQFVAVCAAAALFGCARTSAPELAPFKPSAARDAATIQGHYRQERNFYEGFSLCGVDERPLVAGQSPYEARIAVDPGPRRLTLVTAYTRADTPGPGIYEVAVDVGVTLKPSTHYRVIGRTLPGREAEIWVEEANGGARVSAVMRRLTDVVRPEPGPARQLIYQRGEFSACRTYY